MTIDLSKKTIVLTGALGAIADAIVRVLTDAGAFVILVDIKPPEEAAKLVAERGYPAARTAYAQIDLTDPAQVTRGVDALFAKHPGIDIILGNAGGTLIKDFSEMTTEGFMDTFHLNFTSQMLLTHAVLKHWLPRKVKGHFIYTTTWVSRIPWKGISAYTSSKAALDMFAKTLALEHAKDGIRFNLIAPGNVAAGASKFLYDRDPVYRADVDRISPLGHRNSPESIANGFLYLCSHLGDEVDGHILNVDAGVGLPKVQL